MMHQHEFEERIARAKEAARLASLAASARVSSSVVPPALLPMPSPSFARPPAPHAPQAPAAITTVVPEDVRHRVERLVEFIQRNGPAFEETVRVREHDNPGFGFLHPFGRFHDYFEWRKRQVCGGAMQPPQAPMAPLSVDATLSAMSVGTLASVCKLARQQGLTPYTPLPLELLTNPAALPHVEPARVEIRLAEFYRQAAALM